MQLQKKLYSEPYFVVLFGIFKIFKMCFSASQENFNSQPFRSFMRNPATYK